MLRWAGQPTQGIGILGFKGMGVSNGWLGNPIGFNPRQYIAALQLRANVYPTLEFRARGRDGPRVACRRCPETLESSQHILCQCPAVQESRINRHKRVCALLATMADTVGWVDVAICFERAPDTLSVARAKKVARYQKYGRVIGSAMDVGTVRFFGFPLGARGLWCPGNYEQLSELGLSPRSASRLAARLCRAALIGSVRMLRDFYRVSGWLAGQRWATPGGALELARALTILSEELGGVANNGASDMLECCGMVVLAAPGAER